MKDNSERHTNVVLLLAIEPERTDILITKKNWVVIELDEPNIDILMNLDIEPCAENHRKVIRRRVCIEQCHRWRCPYHTSIDIQLLIRHARQNVTEWLPPRPVLQIVLELEAAQKLVVLVLDLDVNGRVDIGPSIRCEGIIKFYSDILMEIARERGVDAAKADR